MIRVFERKHQLLDSCIAVHEVNTENGHLTSYNEIVTPKEHAGKRFTISERNTSAMGWETPQEFIENRISNDKAWAERSAI